MKDVLPFLRATEDQAVAALRQFVSNNKPAEVNAMLSKCVEMAESADATQVLWGTMGAYALCSAIRSHLEAGGEF